MNVAKHLCRLHGLDQSPDPHDVDDALEIIGQHMQGHFGGDPFQRLHLEMGIAHPTLDRAERMLNRFTPLAHLLWMFIEPLLDIVENMLMFPAGRMFASNREC